MRRMLFGREEGIALFVVLAILVVISLGILAMTNGVGNMQRSAVNFGRSDEAYNAAYTGLNVARGYLAGLAAGACPEAALSLPQRMVGGGTYLVSIAAPVTVREDTDWFHLKDADGQDLPKEHAMVKIMEYTVTSMGNTGQAAKRQLQTTYKVTYTRFWREEVITTEAEFDVGEYDVLSGGNMNLNGDVNCNDPATGTSKLHSNKDFSANGSVDFGVATATGTASQNGSGSGTTYSGRAAVYVPEVDWAAVEANANLPDGSAGKTTELMTGNVTVRGSSLTSTYPNLFIDGNLDISGTCIIGAGIQDLFVDGDVDISGSFTATINIFATGTVTIRGNQHIYGIIYSSYANEESTAISLKGNGTVTGGLITKGTVEVSGNCFAGNIANGTHNPHFEPIPATTTTNVYTYEQALDDSGSNITEIPC